MQKWQYTIVDLGGNSEIELSIKDKEGKTWETVLTVSEYLDWLGTEGWEVVSYSNSEVLLKRPISNAAALEFRNEKFNKPPSADGM